MAKMQENTDRDLGQHLRGDHQRVHGALGPAVDGARARVGPAQGPDHHLVQGLAAARPDRRLSRALAAKTEQPLHLGLTEAGMGMKGLVWSASAMGVLSNEGIGDTIRVSLTPRPGGDRREEVYAACELLQSLGIRSFSPSVTACPGCGRTTSTTFQELAERDPGLHPRPDADLEGPVRRRGDHDARRHGLHRQRPRRVEGREHRHSLCRARVKSRTAPSTSTASTSPRCRATTTSCRPPSARSSTTTSRRSTRGGGRRARGPDAETGDGLPRSR